MMLFVSGKICSPYLTNLTILQIEGGVDATSVAGSHPGMEQKEEPYDPMNIPDVDKYDQSLCSSHCCFCRDVF
jgi:hypothetical protein